jgi:hypothetical protein
MYSIAKTNKLTKKKAINNVHISNTDTRIADNVEPTIKDLSNLLDAIRTGPSNKLQAKIT